VKADSARAIFPGLSNTAVYAYLAAGRTAEARRILEDIKSRPITPLYALNLAVMYGMLGNNDEYFRWIRFEPHHGWVPWIRVEPKWTTPSIRQDPRFQLEMRRMNLPMPRSAAR